MELQEQISRIKSISSNINNIVYEQTLTNDKEINSSEICNVNVVSKDISPDIENWKSLSDEKRNSIVNQLTQKITEAINTSKSEYLNWYKKTETINKFPSDKRWVLKYLGTFLSNIKKIKYYYKPIRAGVIAWVNSSNPTTINYTLPRFHNTKSFTNINIYETTKHEIGHLIDFFFRSNGISTYPMTINTSTQESYQQNYIINDKDQFTRLSFLRGIINAGPTDSAKTLLLKFMSLVDSGEITSNKYNFKTVKNGVKIVKNNTQEATKIYRKLFNNIEYNGKSSMNIEQLFSTFAIENQKGIYVSFDLISNLNLVSKDINKEYYYLKLEPKGYENSKEGFEQWTKDNGYYDTDYEGGKWYKNLNGDDLKAKYVNGTWK
jgi:hypothetical protein